MTVKDLIKNVRIESFDFDFNNQFDAYNVLCDASKKIKAIVDENLKNDELDWYDIFRYKVKFDYKTDFIGEYFINKLRKIYDDIDDDILYSKLIVDSIYDDNGNLMLEVHYEG